MARFLFKEFITFHPSFKLFLATNHLPQVNVNDPAIWRRIRTIPFNRVFAAHEQDRELAEKLKAEQAGILAWIVRGAANWYRDGLAVPAAVANANAEYRWEMDSVGQFVEECCEPRPEGTVAFSGLYMRYKDYCSFSAREPVNASVFGRALSAKGYHGKKQGGVAYRSGLALRGISLEVAA
ncbi:MAG: hypothetical protein A4S16_13445 [Proteobacteria bacterium SG_bin6]|nr:MAG: hypothetical protein A4S16_13445 [Proteobacteria bacterium SG_bin6]